MKFPNITDNNLSQNKVDSFIKDTLINVHVKNAALKYNSCLINESILNNFFKEYELTNDELSLIYNYIRDFLLDLGYTCELIQNKTFNNNRICNNYRHTIIYFMGKN